jgi:hypothetical protein
MNRVKQTKRDELRADYKLSDFPGGFVRGKYGNRLRKSSNIVVLRPEVAEAFPNEEAVNKALLSLIDVARKATRLKKRSTGHARKLRAD